MTEVLAALVPILREKESTNVFANVCLKSEASLRVLISAGFRQVCTTRFNVEPALVGKSACMCISLTTDDREKEEGEGFDPVDWQFWTAG